MCQVMMLCSYHFVSGILNFTAAVDWRELVVEIYERDEDEV